MKIVTCVAPVNIAVIKYWGKRNEDLILPLNDSLSTTLSTDHLCAKTSVIARSDFEEDKFWLNGKAESIANPRVKNCLSKIRELAQNQENGASIPTTWHVHICSENNFPTAAGLASSAAGYACLVYAVAQLYNVSGDITRIARQGSGSACRSILGGFVRWHSGSLDDGSDSIATQVAPASHWPELRILILVVSEHKKKTSSTTGMQRSIVTSNLLKYRVKHVPKRIACMEKAIKEKDFPQFAEITMKDSNQFHAICLDTYPPAVYMNDVSHTIAQMVHKYNEVHEQIKVAYTFDAGPNSCLYMDKLEVPKFLSLVDYIFPAINSRNAIKGLDCEHTTSQELLDKINMKPQDTGLLQYIIHTQLGNGPQILEGDSEHLIDSLGQPLVK